MAPTVWLTCLDHACRARRQYTRDQLGLVRRGIGLPYRLAYRCLACGVTCQTDDVAPDVRAFLASPLSEGPCRHAVTMPAQAARWRICLECDATVHRTATEHYARVTA